MLKLPPVLYKSLCVAVVGASLAACGSANSPSEAENIFGPDNREVVPAGAPYDAVGRLDSGCTGTLIGRRLVVTAAHCIIDAATGTVKPEVKFFRPALKAGKSAQPAWINYAWLGTVQPESDRVNDWAIVRLSEPVGDRFGHLGVQDVQIGAALPYTTSLVGYSQDRDNGDNATLHRGCYVMEVVDGRLYHDCDATSGISGGPLLNQINGNYYIVGITVSEFRRGASGSVTRDGYSTEYANVAIPASRFAQAAQTLLQTADVDIAAPAIAGVTEKTNPNNRTDPGTPDNPGNPDIPGNPPVVYSASDVLPHLTLVQSSLQLRQAFDQAREELRRLTALGDAVRDRQLSQRIADARGATGEFDAAIGRVINNRVMPGYREHIFQFYNAAKAMENLLNRYDLAVLRTEDAQAIGRARADFNRAFAAVEQLVFD